MKTTFFSNYLNHLQLPFCLEMFKELGEDFKFVATEKISTERLKLGYHDMSNMFPFTLNSYDNRKTQEEAFRLGYESDVVLIGSAPNCFIKTRLAANKLTFCYSERVFKKGRFRVLNPKTLYTLWLNHYRHRNKNLYMLCAGAYVSGDFALIGAYKSKTYKWGYFTEFKQHDIHALVENKKQNSPVKLLWAGRFLKWKHPEIALEIAKMLKQKGFVFSLDLIGTGPIEEQLKLFIKTNNLEKEVQILGSMKPEDVRLHMEQANIFLFTSDFNEGWGVVLNESMNSGCAVVASHSIGSVPYLIQNRHNGFIYKKGDVDHLFEKVKTLIENEGMRARLGINAYNTIKECWNPEEAASRLNKLLECLLNGEETTFEGGPCAKAEKISQKFIY